MPQSFLTISLWGTNGHLALGFVCAGSSWLEGKLGGGHHGRFVEARVQFLGRGVQRCQPFGIGAAPERRIHVQP